jgi:hypothetical protein
MDWDWDWESLGTHFTRFVLESVAVAAGFSFPFSYKVRYGQDYKFHATRIVNMWYHVMKVFLLYFSGHSSLLLVAAHSHTIRDNPRNLRAAINKMAYNCHGRLDD